ncbi:MULTISPECIES: DNA-binding protein [unclassified Pseudomonas]|uniref:DNA-binding protein n=1 Tax=unclassified Pseudomonas TaxID=196821 RepID=UPI00244BAFDA|nr:MULTISPECIES: DNA-binding protein [unclassified Pseudomonas]MDH0897674.1 DNA-binding protein [Pseudomonas sp. GD03875]MDH1067814.1 DNA-binding protein [Pseudomonas sp. GD03985]
MELESLEHAKEPALPDVELPEVWAERNGVTPDMARAWIKKAVLPSIKVGKRRMVNCVLLRQHLSEQEWVS